MSLWEYDEDCEIVGNIFDDMELITQGSGYMYEF